MSENTGDKVASFMQDKVALTKWVMVGGSALVVYALFWEKILSLLKGTVEIAIFGCILAVLVFLFPALCEFLASLGWKLWEMAIKSDPLSRLERDLSASATEIEEYEGSIARANTSIANSKTIIKKQANVLSAQDMEEYDAQIKEMEAAKGILVEQRDEMIVAHRKFAADLERYRAKHEIAGAFKASLGAFSFNKKSGSSSRGAKIAFDEIDRQMNQSHEQLKIVMSRPKPKVA